MSLLVDYDSSGDEGAGPAVGGGGSGDLGVDAPTIAAVGSFSRALVAAPLVAPRVRAPVSFFYYLRFFPSGYFCGCSCARLPSVLTARTIGCVHLVAPFFTGRPKRGDADCASGDKTSRLQSNLQRAVRTCGMLPLCNAL